MDEAIRLSPVEKVRLDNVRRYMRRAGSAKLFCEAHDLSRSYISQVAGDRPRIPIGDNAARNLEEKLGLAEGALDIPLGQQPVASLPAAIAEVVEIMQELDEAEQRRVAVIVNALLQHHLATRVREGADKRSVELAEVAPDGNVPWRPASKQSPINEAVQLAFDKKKP